MATSDTLTADLDNPQSTVFGGGGYSGGGLGGGGGYGLGVDPTFMSPSDLWFSNTGIVPWYPTSLYPGQLFGYVFVPPYRRTPVYGYSPYSPVRRGPYVPPPSHRGLVHTTPTFVRHSFSTGAVHAAGRH